jgi:hypothetical protein
MLNAPGKALLDVAVPDSAHRVYGEFANHHRVSRFLLRRLLVCDRKAAVNADNAR